MIKLVRQNYRKNKQLYKKIELQLKNSLDETVVIDHVGSTAIPKMSGKNIIDVLVGVCEYSDIETIARKIDAIGYHRGKNNPRGEYIFFASTTDETTSGDIHVHLAVKGSERYNGFIAMRDYLINNPDAAREYSDYKHNIAKVAKFDREQYKKLKSSRVEQLLKEAKNVEKSL